MQLPKTHKRGSGCKQCGLLKVSISKKSNNDKFINNAKLIHGDKYDYSKVEYIKSNQNVIIICPIHGEFLQKPNGHLSKKAGCIKCSTQINSNKQRKTTEQFIIDAKLIHGNKYDYSKVDYKNVSDKVIIICSSHGDFLQSPNHHLGGKGCKKCSGCYKSNTKEFIEKSKQIHNDKYDYSKVDYKNVSDKVIIICPTHGDFIQTPNTHLCGAGCQKCANKMYIFTNSDFIEKAKILHGNKYNYDMINYTKMSEKVIILCPIHKEFEQTPSNHITHKQGCPICAGHYLSNTEEFIEKSIKKHGNKYDYSSVKYINNNTNIKIICTTHGIFYQTPASHLRGCGCQKCNIIGYSKAQILWLNFIATYYNIHIQHAENDGEYTIPTTRYKADGYCKETSTIYEYHGSYWHGDPNIYDENEINKVNKKTFGELYAITQKKEQLIKDMGYNLAVMWESNWIKINMSISILQNKFREKYK
jgi:hypothetical protein